MNVKKATHGDPDGGIAPLAAAIGEPARARMLYCLADGRARTSTELAVVAAVTPSTASVHRGGEVRAFGTIRRHRAGRSSV
jgi:DNA-binding transcriptional ArsR family regulator